jgi:hypothetical protein
MKIDLPNGGMHLSSGILGLRKLYLTAYRDERSEKEVYEGAIVTPLIVTTTSQLVP